LETVSETFWVKKRGLVWDFAEFKEGVFDVSIPCVAIWMVNVWEFGVGGIGIRLTMRMRRGGKRGNK